MPRARVFPRTVRSALTRTSGYLAGYTHSLQPYVGCEFSCRYCYVREMTVQRANPYRLAWSEWISPKTDIAERLRGQGKRGSLSAARVFMSSTTDPYTPIERKLRLTRSVLEVMREFPPEALVIQTRSPLVLRDLDLLAALPAVGVSVTITTDDEKVRRRFEPDSPRVTRRIEMLAALRAAGIPTQAAVSPILPCNSARLAALLEPVADRVVIDDFARGDGAGGTRSRAASLELERLGHGAWLEPAAADDAVEVFRRILGPDRVVFSQPGFNTLEGWIRQPRVAQFIARRT